MYWVVWALFLSLIGTGWQVWDWWTERKRRIEECRHRWDYRSLYNFGVQWERHCLDCPKSEKCEADQVPEAERKRAEEYRKKVRGG